MLQCLQSRIIYLPASALTGLVFYWYHLARLCPLVAALRGVEASRLTFVGGPGWCGGHVVGAGEVERGYLPVLPILALSATRLTLVVLHHKRLKLVVVDPGVPHPVDEELVLPGQEDAAGVLVLRGDRILIGKYPSLLQSLCYRLSISANVPERQEMTKGEERT